MPDAEGLPTLTICLGSSCFTRGNDENLPRLQAFLKRKGLEDKVALRGARCEGRCQHGPNLRLGEAFLDPATCLEGLEQAL
jgi:NADH:ubiquinone oxidoreductase subunit E